MYRASCIRFNYLSSRWKYAGNSAGRKGSKYQYLCSIHWVTSRVDFSTASMYLKVHNLATHINGNNPCIIIMVAHIFLPFLFEHKVNNVRHIQAYQRVPQGIAGCRGVFFKLINPGSHQVWSCFLPPRSSSHHLLPSSRSNNSLWNQRRVQALHWPGHHHEQYIKISKFGAIVILPLFSIPMVILPLLFRLCDFALTFLNGSSDLPLLR